MISEDIASNIRHPPVKVKRHENPFTDEQLLAFSALLQEAFSHVTPNPATVNGIEWEAIEPIPLGKRKALSIDIDDSLWRQRAQKWVYAVELLTRVEMEL